MTKKNYKIKDLLLDKELYDILNEISTDLKIRNTDLARFILNNELKRIKALGVSNYSFAIIGHKKS